MSTNTAPSLIANHTGATGKIADYLHAHGQTLQPDGRLISLGGGSTILRINPDGTLHSAVGTTPDVRFGQDNTYFSVEANGFQLMPDGKVVVGGTYRTSRDTDPSGFVLYRLNADGTVDKTFAKGQGWVSANPGDREEATGMLATPDGKFLVVGTSGSGPVSAPGNNAIAISRFTSKGELDLGFGEQGTAKIQGDNIFLHKTMLQADGKILAVGSRKNGSANEAVIYRINADGSPDTSFGNGGSTIVAFDSPVSQIQALAIQPDGKIVTASVAYGHNTPGITSMYGIARLNADGTLDQEFGNGGKTVVFPGSPPSSAEQAGGTLLGAWVTSVLVRQDGSIIAGGSILNSSPASGQYSLLALRANGEVDTSFGTNGFATSDRSAGSTFSHNLVEMRDGRLFISGLGGPASEYAIHSFNANGTRDLTFGAAGTGSSNTVNYKEGHAAIALNSGIILQDQELAVAGYRGASLVLQRHGGPNASDSFDATGRLSFIDGNIVVGGEIIGSVQSGAGSLRLDFNANATQALVNLALRGIAYRNTADLDANATVKIDWIFNDGGAANAAALTAQASTDVRLIAGKAPAWIEQLLDTSDAIALRQDLRAYLGQDPVLNVHYRADGNAAPLTEAERAMVDDLLASIAAHSGLRFGTQAGSNALEIHSSAELGKGKFAFAELSSNGADIYLGKPGSGTIRSLLPELNMHLMHVLGLGGDSTMSTNLSPLHIAALQYLYGPSTTMRTGDDTYKLDSVRSHMLWDGAGTDTIDGSGLSHDLTLHLEAGHWDYVGSKGISIGQAGQITINYGSKFENANGGSGNDKLFGTTEANVLRGGAGNDFITGNGGDDTIDGGAGLDTVNFAGKRADHSVTATANGFSISSSTSLDSVTGVERLHFADGDKALDIDGKAGQLFRLYQAIFNRKPDEAGLGYWLKAVDNGTTMESVALEFTKSAEFAKMYGVNVSNREMLTKIYDYALHRQPDNDGFAWWLDVLDNKKASLGTVLYGFSESKE
ncbi:DUF4214 domain-containing protein, partial [Pseudoduganella sp.]|uniref:DUF4214 domain-containing protein n=1 Tax=Pseudoduganella sp. TaxID=1880898 RepID=UPI0035B34B8D